MPDRNLFFLLAATLIAVISCLFVVNNRYATTEFNVLQGGLVFSELGNQANEVREIEIQRNQDSFTLTRKGNRWVNSGVGGFPIEPGRVENIVVSLATLKYVEPKTTRNELYQRLDVGDVGADSNSTRLILRNTKGDQLADVIVGKAGKIGTFASSVYIRQSSNDQAWLVEGNLDVRYDAVDWMDRLIIDIKAKDLAALTVMHTDKEIVMLKRLDKSRMTLATLPVGREIRHQHQVDFLSGLLQQVMFSDVAPISENEKKSPSMFEAIAETKERLQIRLFANDLEPDGSIWVRFEGAVSNEALTSDDVRQQADDLNSRFDGWRFKLPRKFADRLKIRLGDIIGTTTVNN